MTLKEHYKQMLLNELGDTQKGKDALRRYIHARAEGVEKMRDSRSRIRSAYHRMRSRLEREPDTDMNLKRRGALLDIENRSDKAIARYRTGLRRARDIVYRGGLTTDELHRRKDIEDKW